MLKPWHEEDIRSALEVRGWTFNERLASDSYELSHAELYARAGMKLRLNYVADLGTGYTGPDSVESVLAPDQEGREPIELWLARRRDGRWRAALATWADALKTG